MKNLLLSIFVFISSFVFSQSCTHQIYLTDTWGDGWNGGAVSVSVNGITVLNSITLTNGLGPAIFNFTASSGQTIRVWRTIAGTFPSEMRVQIRNNVGTILLNTIQPVTGSATTGGYTCIASCSGGGGGGGGTLVPFSGSNSVSCGTNTILYDHGGQFGSYSNYANGFTVLNNGGSAVITLNGTSSGEWCCDWVRVYQGAGTGGAIIGTYQMGSVIPTISSAPGQALTVQFYSDVSVTGSGFSINVTYSGSCVAGPPPNPTSVSASAATVCSGQSVTLTANGSVGTTYWYTGGCGVGQIATGSSITVNPVTTTTYFARNLNSGFWSPGCAQTTITVSSPPQAPTSITSSVNCGVSPTLTAVGGAGNYQWWSNSNATGLLATGQTYNPGPLTQNATYWVTSSNGICNSTASSYQVNILPLTQPFVNNTTINCGQTSTLSAFGGSGTYAWFSNSNGTGQLGTGSNFTTPPLTTTTTYYVASTSGSASIQSVGFNDCYSTGNWSVQHLNGGNGFVNTGGAPNTITLTGPDGTSGNAYTLYQITVPATGTISWNWSVVHNDCSYDTYGYRINGIDYPLATCGASGFTSVNVTAGQTFAFYGRSHDGCCGTFTATISNFSKPCIGSSCQSALVPVTVNVNPLTITVNPLNPSVCFGSQTTLTASGGSSYSWNVGSVSSSITVGPAVTTTYNVTGTLNGCSNTASTTVTVTSAPSSNAGMSQTGNSTCGINQVTLGANTPQAGQTGTWSVVSGVGGSFSNINSPTSTFTGNYGSTYTLQWTVNHGGCSTQSQTNITFNQPNATSLGAAIGTNDLLWGGLTSTDWSTSTNWYQKQAAGHFIRMSGVAQPTSSSQVFTLNQASGGICIGNTTPTLSVDGNAYDVFINPGINLNLTNDSLNISHDIVNNGTLTATNGTVSFVGNQNSSFIGNGTSQLLNMKVNKSQGATLTLNHNVSVTGNLNMIQGNIFTSNNALLTLGSSSSNIGSLTYNTGIIVGPFKRFFNNLPTNGNEGLFPVGTSNYNRYSSFQFTTSPGVNQSLTVQYKTGAPIVNGTPLYNGLPLMVSNALIQNYSIDGYWEVTPTSNNYSSSICQTPYNVTLFANNLNGMTTPQICRIIKSPGSVHSSWQPCGNHVAIPGNANPMAFLITSNNTQGFSWFNIGTPNSQALPVELLSFDGFCNDNVITLNWRTASEHNSHYFEILKSRDGQNWSSLTTVESAGNSTQELSYETKDHKAIDENNYYKLIQYDNDGQSKEYGPINIICNGNSKGYFSIFPNPSSGDFQVIVNNKQLIGEGDIIIKDTKGSLVYSEKINIKNGINLFNITNLNLSTGTYYVNINSNTFQTEILKQVIK